VSAGGGDHQGRITGRGFASRQDDAFRALNDSIGFDWRLAPYDVDQSIAHATMLGAQGIIDEGDAAALTAGLEQVRDELRDGAFPFADDDEDIHMAIERRLTEIVGPVGGRLHTARARAGRT
jgi:argininosuccinate lyase